MNKLFVILELSKANDGSSHFTTKVARKIPINCFNLSLLKHDGKHSKSKHIALKKFVIRTKSDNISLKDADCKPEFKFCLQKINACISEKLNFFLGYPLYGHNPLFLNEFIKSKSLKIEIHYRHRALSNKAYKCGDRSVTYQKSVLLEGKSRINLDLTSESFVLDHSKKSCILWHKQKHSTTSPFYYKLNQLFIQDYYFFQFLFWSTFFILLSREFMMALFIFRIAIVAKSLIAAEFQKAFKVPQSILWIWPNFGESLLILQMGIGINRIFQKT